MRKLALLTLLLVLAGVGIQAQNIVKSLERTVPGQGKVTIHQVPRIGALIGVERPATGEHKVIKASGYRIQALVDTCAETFRFIPLCLFLIFHFII